MLRPLRRASADPAPIARAAAVSRHLLPAGRLRDSVESAAALPWRLLPAHMLRDGADPVEGAAAWSGRVLPAGMLSLLLLACADPRPDPAPVERAAALSWSLLPAGQRNHLLPQYVAVDPLHRRLVVTSNAGPTLARIDLDAGRLLDVLPLAGDAAFHARGVVVDGLGMAYVLSAQPPYLQRVDEAGGVELPLDIDAAFAFASRPDGGVVLGATVDGVDTLLSLDPQGQIQASAPITGYLSGLAAGDDGLVYTLAGATGRAVALSGLDPQTLAPAWSCESDGPLNLPQGFARLEALGDGGFLAIWNTALIGAACPPEGGTGAFATGTQGIENKAAVPIPGGALLFDRIAGTAPDAALYGEARPLGLDLSPLAPAWRSGQNTGAAALDPVTGLVWFSSEGTTEVWAADPSTGERVHTVETGVYVESVAPDPSGKLAWFTGRLSNLLGRVDLATGAITTTTEALLWPVAPTLFEGRLFVLTQMSGQLVEIDPDSLLPLQTFDLGLPQSGALTFSDLQASVDRHSLFLAHAASNTLLELDPDTGDLLGQWPLSGGPIPNEDLPGRLELRLLPGGALTVRNNDGALTRIDFDAADPIATGTLDTRVIAETYAAMRLERLSATSFDGAFFFGGRAFDADSLLRRPDDDVDDTQLIGRTPAGGRLAWRLTDEGSALRTTNSVGDTLDTLALSLGADSGPQLRLVPAAPARLFTVDLNAVAIGVVPVEGLLHGSPNGSAQ